MPEPVPTPTPSADRPAPYLQDPSDGAGALVTDLARGLLGEEARRRLDRFGPNRITGERPPSIVQVALLQLRDPMNLMLVAVTVVSVLIGEVSTGLIVALLIVLNIVLGTRQEMKARASVDALSKMQVPQAKVVRDGSLSLVAALDVVPGDLGRPLQGGIDSQYPRSAA